MKKIILVLFIIFLLIFPVIFIYYYENIPDNNDASDANDNETKLSNPLEGGWLKEQDGVKILYLNGSNYMMGYQYGYYLAENIEQYYRCAINLFKSIGCSYDDFIDVWNAMKDNIPKNYIQEMEGIKNGSNLSWDKIIILNTVPAVVNLYMCSGMSAWGSATKNGEVIHFRSLDASLDFKDDVSGKYFQELQAIVLRNPDYGYRSVSFSLIGDVGSWGGFNEKGIAVGGVSCRTDDTTFAGINIAFRMRMVQDYADSMDDAIKILNSNRDCGWNLFVSDGNMKKGVVIEQTANHVYVGDWNNPVGSNRPFYDIKDVVRRTNFFINPETAKTQRDHYNPCGLLGLFRLLFKHDVYFFEWQHYKTLSKEIKRNHGSLDLYKTMDMVRDVYSGKRNLIFRYFQNRGGKKDIHQWVANPKTGDFLISYASVDKCAHENPVHYFNFYELLEQ